MFSDAYDYKLVDGAVYEVDCKMITIKKGADVGMSQTKLLQNSIQYLW